MEFKRKLKGFPKEIVARMVECQVEQRNPADISIFESNISAGAKCKGFTWTKTTEGAAFWHNVIDRRDFALFFKKYPKKIRYTYTGKYECNSI